MLFSGLDSEFYPHEFIHLIVPKRWAGIGSSKRDFQHRKMVLWQLSSPDVSFYIYDTLNKIYLNKSIFYDEAHLQTTGAILFTNEIIKELRTSENTPGNNKRLL